jgi:sensor histidine kinase regulating citrate/malate metabolism
MCKSCGCATKPKDNGPGIPDDFKSIIFNRVLKGTKKARGHGPRAVHCTVARGKLPGRVWVEDRVSGDCSKGARFVVMLPAIEK